jgi:hypothetical protein
MTIEDPRTVCKRTRAFWHSWRAGVRLAKQGISPDEVTERASELARAFAACHCQTLREKDRARFCLTYGEVLLDAYSAVREDSLVMQRRYRPIGP